MRRVGIITFHFAINVGAVLQCTALYEQIRKLGADPFIINYRPKYHSAKYAAFRPPFYLSFKYAMQLKHQGLRGSRRIVDSIKRFISIMLENRHFLNHKKKNDRFEAFLSSYLQQSKCYHSTEELNSDPPKGDVYISGSDQVWNKHLTDGGFDSAYFLKFGSRDAIRIAYAVSMGDTDILSERDSFLRGIEGFNAVYFRESVDCKKANSFKGQNCMVVRDPTMLLPKEEWEKYAETVSVPDSYFFVYTVLKSEPIKKTVNELCKESVSVVDGSVHDYIGKSGAYYHYDSICGPGEFLSYIKNADFVITNSFHGTVFSILFQKEFVTVANNRRNERLEEILRLVGLENRLVTECSAELIRYLKPIDYAPINAIIEESRDRDIELLRHALQ